MKEKLVISCLLGSFYLIKIAWSFSDSTMQTAMITKAMIKFLSKFQFQILLQITGQLKKLPKSNLWWQWSHVLTNITIFPTFHILVTILYFSWLRFKHTEHKGILTNKISTKKDIIVWNIKSSPPSFFNHSFQPSPLPIAKLKSLHCVSRGQLPPQKWAHLFVVCHPYVDFKISPNLHALPSPMNMTTMIRQPTNWGHLGS